MNALGQIGPEAKAATPAFTRLLKDKDKGIRSTAAWALLNINGPEAKEAMLVLTNSLNDKDLSVRWHAARTLGSLGPKAKSAIPALMVLLEHKNAAVQGEGPWTTDLSVQCAAAAAICEIGGPQEKSSRRVLNEFTQKKIFGFGVLPPRG